MSEKELRKEKLRPVTETVTKVGAVIGKGAYDVGKTAYKGLEWLGKEGKKPRVQRKETPLDLDIDLGFGKGKGKSKEAPLDLDIKIR